MSKKLSKEETDYEAVSDVARRVHRAIAARFNVPLQNVVFLADIQEDGTVQISCTVHRKNKHEIDKGDIT